MMEQKVIYVDKSYEELNSLLLEIQSKSILLVCDDSINYLKIRQYLNNLTARTGINLIRFHDFSPNPCYESVVKGVEVFRVGQCDTILAVGGGSAIDVAKCIKLYSNMKMGENYLQQPIISNDVKLIAVPTTAGTGSEATRFAVIYYEGVKQSVFHDSCIPSVIVFDSSTLESLPIYQKKSSMMDALCHAVESYWSVNSTIESKAYSAKAIQIILSCKDSYLDGDTAVNAKMLSAANCAGKAINITQTTAGHAMSYKITSLYHIAHGHSAAICLPYIWNYMLDNPEPCADPRGNEYLKVMFRELAGHMGVDEPWSAIRLFENILCQLELSAPVMERDSDLTILVKSVNLLRLKNNPVALDEAAIRTLYKQIFRC